MKLRYATCLGNNTNTRERERERERKRERKREREREREREKRESGRLTFFMPFYVFKFSHFLSNWAILSFVK